MDIYNAVTHSTREVQLRQKVAVGPEGTTYREESIGGEKVPAGSPCYIISFDKKSGTFEGVLKPRREKI